jgi:GR25 family glycosyltransferase involved in LPS biosynthesis
MYTYNASAKELARLRSLKQEGGCTKKGVYDYTYALQRCYETGASYIEMFEDDIMLASGWLVRTLKGLRKVPAIDDTDHPWLFVRLFNPERSTGWANRHVGGNNEALIIVCIALLISGA